MALPNTALPDSFETDRLQVRRYQPGDAAAFFATIDANRAHLDAWIRFAGRIGSLDDARMHIQRMQVQFWRRERLALGLWRKADGRYLGDCSLTGFNWAVPYTWIGYWVDGTVQGQGYVSEAVRGMTQLAFTALGMARVGITCDPANTRSAAVAERCGYTLEGKLRHVRRDPAGALGDLLYFCMTAEEFYARR